MTGRVPPDRERLRPRRSAPTPAKHQLDHARDGETQRRQREPGNSDALGASRKFSGWKTLNLPQSPPPSPPRRAPGPSERRRVGLLPGVAIGIGAALIGLPPWIVTGMRLPLQNLCAVEVRPEDMPVALLPFSNYVVTLACIGPIASHRGELAARAAGADALASIRAGR
ncbi:MAG: hypothetical protein JWP66_1413 [Naasia sp.]|nr:hypothetical protein [Naasia sp.]